MSHKLTYTQHDEIDRHRWDLLVSASSDALVFYNTWYLDPLCNWDAIIYSDYKGAIVLPRSKRFGVSTLYQPNFIQKCNWFGNSLTNEEKVHIWKLITSNFNIIHFNTNINFGENVKIRTNLILPSAAYSDLQKGYSKSLKKNIKKHEKNLLVQECMDVDSTIRLYRDAYGDLNKQLRSEHYLRLRSIVLSRPKNFVIVQVLYEGAIVSSTLLAKGNKRLHYILGAPTTKGRQLNALSVALDYAIREYGSKEYIIDFEGSNIPSVKKYYESFGSTNEPFFEIKASSTPIRVAKNIYNKVFKS